jgi:hypothetical protein
VHDAHAPTAATARSLDDDRVADVSREAQILVIIVAEWAV